MDIRLLWPTDFDNGFLATLEALRPVDLTSEEAYAVFLDRGPHLLTYVAVVNTRIVGTATLRLERKFIHSGGLAGYLEDVAVHKEHQGEGIGKALVDKVISEAFSRGCYKLNLECSAELCEYYAAFGFKMHGHVMTIRV